MKRIFPAHWLSLPHAFLGGLRLSLYPLIFPFFPLCAAPPWLCFSSHSSPWVRGRSGLAVPPSTAPSPLPGGTLGFAAGGPGQADRAIQALVTPAVTNRPRLTRMDGAVSRAAGG